MLNIYYISIYVRYFPLTIITSTANQQITKLKQQLISKILSLTLYFCRIEPLVFLPDGSQWDWINYYCTRQRGSGITQYLRTRLLAWYTLQWEGLMGQDGFLQGCYTTSIMELLTNHLIPDPCVFLIFWGLFSPLSDFCQHLCPLDTGSDRIFCYTPPSF